MTPRTKFNPRQPVTIHNPWPSEKWPIKKGARVYFLWNGLFLQGKVTFYNPARPQDSGMLVTEGHPFYTVSTGGWANPVPADSVQPFTKAGLMRLRETTIHKAEKEWQDRKRIHREEERNHLDYLADLSNLRHPHPHKP